MKKCRPLVKEPSGGTLLFRCALPARGASLLPLPAAHGGCLCLGAACTGCIVNRVINMDCQDLCLGAACTGCIGAGHVVRAAPRPLPRRCLHGVHLHEQVVLRPDQAFASALPARGASHAPRAGCDFTNLCLGAACTGCIVAVGQPPVVAVAFASALPARGASNRLRQTKHARTLPRRCLHGVHQGLRILRSHGLRFASALPARGASAGDLGPVLAQDLCLGAACTGCIAGKNSGQ